MGSKGPLEDSRKATEVANDSGKGKEISHRTALKLLALLAAAAPVGVRMARAKGVETDPGERTSKEKAILREAGVIFIEKENVQVQILLDEHDNTKLKGEVVRAAKPHIVLTESDIPNREVLIAGNEPGLLLYQLSTDLGQTDAGRTFGDDVLEALSDLDGHVVMASDGIPMEYFIWGASVELSLPAISLLLKAADVISKSQKGNKYTKSWMRESVDKWADTIKNAAFVWGVSSFMPAASALINLEDDEAQKILDEGGRLISSMHPENFPLFVRNLIITERVNALSRSKELRKELGLRPGEKLKVMVRVGKRHELETVMSWSDELVAKVLSLYPEHMWEGILGRNQESQLADRVDQRDGDNTKYEAKSREAIKAYTDIAVTPVRGNYSREGDYSGYRHKIVIEDPLMERGLAKKLGV